MCDKIESLDDTSISLLVYASMGLKPEQHARCMPIEIVVLSGRTLQCGALGDHGKSVCSSRCLFSAGFIKCRRGQCAKR